MISGCNSPTQNISAFVDHLFFTSALNFLSNLFRSAGSYSSISMAILFSSHHVFHTLNQSEVLLLVLTWTAGDLNLIFK